MRHLVYVCNGLESVASSFYGSLCVLFIVDQIYHMYYILCVLQRRSLAPSQAGRSLHGTVQSQHAQSKSFVSHCSQQNLVTAKRPIVSAQVSSGNQKVSLSTAFLVQYLCVYVQI
jgi:hypothetical protein